MGIGTGMRGKDVRAFCRVARQYNIFILVRHTNEASLGYIGRTGYYPKPATIKAKTADVDPPPMQLNRSGMPKTVQHRVAGLVPHPGFQPKVFAGAKMAKALDCWADTLDVLHGEYPRHHARHLGILGQGARERALRLALARRRGPGVAALRLPADRARRRRPELPAR